MFGITAQENCIAQLPTSHPFRTLENVLATPHIDYLTEELLPDVLQGCRGCMAPEFLVVFLDWTPWSLLMASLHQ